MCSLKTVEVAGASGRDTGASGRIIILRLLSMWHGHALSLYVGRVHCDAVSKHISSLKYKNYHIYPLSSSTSPGPIVGPRSSRGGLIVEGGPVVEGGRVVGSPRFGANQERVRGVH